MTTGINFRIRMNIAGMGSDVQYVSWCTTWSDTFAGKNPYSGLLYTGTLNGVVKDEEVRYSNTYSDGHMIVLYNVKFASSNTPYTAKYEVDLTSIANDQLIRIDLPPASADSISFDLNLLTVNGASRGSVTWQAVYNVDGDTYLDGPVTGDLPLTFRNLPPGGKVTAQVNYGGQSYSPNPNLFTPKNGQSYALAVNVGSSTVYGCTDPSADNYDPSATVNNGSCTYSGDTGGPVYGCTDESADNYNPNASIDDGSCVYGGSGSIGGCTDPDALNYNPNADYNDGSCYYGQRVVGCTDPTADNFNPDAEVSDGSCEYGGGGWTWDSEAIGINLGSMMEMMMMIMMVGMMAKMFTGGEKKEIYRGYPYQEYVYEEYPYEEYPYRER